MSNLVERLRESYSTDVFLMEVAAEIERLRIERRTLPEYDDAISAISKENLRLEAEIERLEAENDTWRGAAKAAVKAKAKQEAGIHTAYHTGIAIEALAALLEDK